MRSGIFIAILISTFFCQAQVTSIEVLPEIINKKGTSNSAASFNSNKTRLCFYRLVKNEKKKVDSRWIMISDKLPSGEWGEPYPVIPLPAKGILQGLYLNSIGNRIYLSWNDDITLLENLGDKLWGVMLKVDHPISIDLSERYPSILSDERALMFIRNIREEKSSDWKEIPFISKRQANGQWSTPSPIQLTQPRSHFEEFVVSPDGEIAFYSTATATSNENWYIHREDSVFSAPHKIDFSAGRITWMSEDYTTALATAFTMGNTKIVVVNFNKNWLGKESVSDITPSVTRDLMQDNFELSTVVKPTGKFFGLIIGVSAYAHDQLNLDNPVKDASQLRDILTTHYQFTDDHTTLLLNPTRQQIMSELFRLRSIITPADNLLIFYAGHGFWDKNVEQGYWWPYDARPDDPSNWLSNSDLREQIRGIKSGHTLLISDACFSGGIFRVRSGEEIRMASLSIQQLYKTRSRRAITSGNLSSVPDQSVFFRYLSDRLVNNTEKFLPAQSLYNSFKIAVMNNSGHPLEGVINDAGDEGGDFIFILKD